MLNFSKPLLLHFKPRNILLLGHRKLALSTYMQFMHILNTSNIFLITNKSHSTATLNKE